MDRLIFLHAAYDRNSASYQDMVEKSPWRRIQVPGLDVDCYAPGDYFAAMKRAYPSFTAIWTVALEEQSLHEIIKTPDGKIIDRMSDAISQGITDTLTSYVLEDSKIKAQPCPFSPFSKASIPFPMSG